MSKLTFPLFHGTSTLFLDSIRKNGLGAINPVEQYGALEFLNALYPICKKELSEDSQWQIEGFLLESIIDQKISKGGFNWRHGNAYVSPECSKAVNHALYNEYGSEALTMAIRWYERLLHQKPKFDFPEEITSSQLLELRGHYFEPIIVEVKKDVLTVTDLIGEKDEDPATLLEKIEGNKKSGDIGKILNQQCNFYLRTVVPPENLIFYNLKDSDTKDVDFELCRNKQILNKGKPQWLN